MFEGFERRLLPGIDGVEINAVIGGTGPPLLLLHGFPQSHVAWHLVAPILARRFTVVATDLRGYGDSSKPESDPAHLVYSKRSTAADQVAAMRSMGFARFYVAGWDRGGRVAHRMALDHPEAVERLAILDITPTRETLRATTSEFARAYFHWFFLSQPYDFPEKMILANPEFFVLRNLNAGPGGILEGTFKPEALAEYVRCYRNPGVVHATCEDYRAMFTIDIQHDDEDGPKKVTCPTYILWGSKTVVHLMFDPLTMWSQRVEGVTGEPLPSTHFLCEEIPDIVAVKLLTFFFSR